MISDVVLGCLNPPVSVIIPVYKAVADSTDGIISDDFAISDTISQVEHALTIECNLSGIIEGSR